MRTKKFSGLTQSALAVALTLGLAAPMAQAASTDKVAADTTKSAKKGAANAGVDAPVTHGGSAPAAPEKKDEVFPRGSKGDKAADKARSGDRTPAANPATPAVEGGTTAGRPDKLNEALPKGSSGPSAAEKAGKGERLAPAASTDAPASHGGSKAGTKKDKQ